MTFDLQKAKEQSKDNPVYYMQYAYARACSVLKKYNTMFPNCLDTLSHNGYNFSNASNIEQKLIKMLGDYPSIIESACKNKAPTLLTKYLEELSAVFHSLWSSNGGVKLITEEDKTSTNNHMLMVMALKNVIANGLQTLGCTLKESM